MALLYDDQGSHDSKSLGLDENAIEIFLDPGEYFVGDSTFKVRTLLGSCVSMILWHQRMQYGAMSHFLLSSRKTSQRESDIVKAPQSEGKYADEVIDIMMRELKQAKVPLHECVAKVFGGGNMFPDQKMTDRLNVGKKNGETAKQLLHERGFRIVAEDLFGIGHREIIFNLGNGDVWVRQGRPVAKLPI